MPYREVSTQKSTSVSEEISATDAGELDSAIALVEARLHILQLRDFAIGEAARVGELKSRLNTKEHELADALRVNLEKNIHLQNHGAHIARLEELVGTHHARTQLLVARSDELERVYASRTWKIGRFLLLPIRAIKRLIRKT